MRILSILLIFGGSDNTSIHTNQRSSASIQTHLSCVHNLWLSISFEFIKNITILDPVHSGIVHTNTASSVIILRLEVLVFTSSRENVICRY